MFEPANLSVCHGFDEMVYLSFVWLTHKTNKTNDLLLGFLEIIYFVCEIFPLLKTSSSVGTNCLGRYFPIYKVSW